MNELAEPFPISVQAVSKHLKVLERAGLITRGRSAQLRPSRLQGAPLKEAVDWLEKYRRFWEGSFDRLDERLQATEKGPRMAEPRTPTAPPRGSRSPASSTRRASACGRSGPSPSASRTGSAAPRPRCRCRPSRWTSGPGARGGRRCSPTRGAARSSGRASTARSSSPSGSCSPISDQPGDDALRAGHRRPHRPRRRPDRDALRAARPACRPSSTSAPRQGWSTFFDRIAERLAGA